MNDGGVDGGGIDAGADAGTDGGLDAGIDGGTEPDSGYGPPLCPVTTTSRSVTTQQSALPAMVWVGSGYVLATDEVQASGAYEVALLRVDARGAAVAGPTMITPLDGNNSIWPSVDFSGNEYGVTYLDDRATPVRQAYFARADLNLQLVPGSELLLGTADAAKVAWSTARREWGVAITRGPGNGGGIHFMRLSPTGSLLSTVNLSGALSDTGTPLIATSTGWALVASGSPPQLVELSDATPVTTTLTGSAGRAALAASPGQFAIVFDSPTTSAPLTLVRALPGGGGLIANSELSLGTLRAYGASTPNIAWDGQAFIVTWSESYLGFAAPIMFVRVSPTAVSASLPGSSVGTPTNAGFHALAVGSCGVGIVYNLFDSTPTTLLVRP